MPLGEELRGHLPYLRRYARALTGSQQHGDNFVHTTLEVIVAAPDEFSAGNGTRIDLYRNFHRIWESAYIDDGEGSDDGEDPFVRAANKRLAQITPLGRQILLLTALEGFSVGEASIITGTDGDTVETLLAEAVADLDRESCTSVLIIEDEPLIAMELEQIVRDLGHTVAGRRHHARRRGRCVRGDRRRAGARRYSARRRIVGDRRGAGYFGDRAGAGDLHHRLSRTAADRRAGRADLPDLEAVSREYGARGDQPELAVYPAAGGVTGSIRGPGPLAVR